MTYLKLKAVKGDSNLFQEIKFGLWPSTYPYWPTDIKRSNKPMLVDAIKDAYIKHVTGCDGDEEHLTKLNDFLTHCECDGYTIEWYETSLFFE